MTKLIVKMMMMRKKKVLNNIYELIIKISSIQEHY